MTAALEAPSAGSAALKIMLGFALLQSLHLLAVRAAMGASRVSISHPLEHGLDHRDLRFTSYLGLSSIVLEVHIHPWFA